jgi:hypothetical protein
MTPLEKTKELYNKFYAFEVHSNSVEVRRSYAKRCALIAVEELIKNDKGSDTDYVSGVGYWQQVKDEIEKL